MTLPGTWVCQPDGCGYARTGASFCDGGGGTWMFTVSDSEAAAIRAAFDEGGEFSAAVELRRLFPGITDSAKARQWARVIAGWKPAPPVPATVVKFTRRNRNPAAS